jgi:hypothetical protein
MIEWTSTERALVEKVDRMSAFEDYKSLSADSRKSRRMTAPRPELSRYVVCVASKQVNRANTTDYVCSF